VVVAALAAGCGSATSSSTAPPPAAGGGSVTAPETAPAKVVNPATMVLRRADVGAGYTAVAGQSKRIGLAEELQHESAAAKRADHAAFVGGYKTSWGDRAKLSIILSGVWEYKDESAATIVGNDLTGLKATPQLTVHRIAVPAGLPGSNRMAFTATIDTGSAKVPAIIVKWQHGRTIDSIFLIGPHSTMPAVVALAKKQDAHVTAAGL
jgi:hypothetical protein